MKKKGQEGASPAAALIAVITLLIVLYFLVLPPTEREKILDGEDGTSSTVSKGNVTIFELEGPKKFMPVTQKTFEQSIPSVNLYISEEGVELKNLASLYAEKSLFSEKRATVTFDIDDLADTKNVLLNFMVAGSQGRLIILLNGNQMYDSEISQQNINPIALKDGLRQGTNTLEFATSSPGFSFWRTNYYSLVDILVTANIVKREGQESKNLFILTESEKENMEKVKLRFFPQCTESEVGALNILVNNYQLYSAIPDCGSPNIPIEFSPEHLVIGENTLSMRADKGRYLIEQIKISADLKKVDPAIYYFKLTDKQYESISKGKKVYFHMEFVDEYEQKQANITINGDLMRLDQTEIEYTKDITSKIVKGNNVLKIEPKTMFDAVEFRVYITT